MKSIIDELWYGNICPQENESFRQSQYKEMCQREIQCQNVLYQTLTDEQKEHLEKTMDAFNELNAYAERSIFAYGVRLGAMMMLDIMKITP